MPAPTPLVHVNTMSKALNLKFPVPMFYDEDPELWCWQLEGTFTVNKVTTLEKEKYMVVLSNLPFKVGRRIPRTIIAE